MLMWADVEWAVVHQTVVPKKYWGEILSVTHESSMTGHLDVNKTYQKILNHLTGYIWEKMFLNTVSPVMCVR